MALSINVGRAWIEGKWYKNDTAFTDFSVPTAPTGDRGRVDRVVLRLDNNISGREIELAYLTGTPAISPTAPALTRSDGIYEIALADIAVNPNVTTITQSDIYDRRADSEVCGWVTSPVGYDDYFVNLDTEFNTWFDEKKDTLASVTMVKQYHWGTTATGSTTTVTFNIPQYDPTGVDIVQVYTDGLLMIEDTDYTLSNSTITFTTAKPADTNIDVFVYKSIDGTGLGSVSDEVTALQNQVDSITEYMYFCNGSTDNVELTNIAQTFLANDTAYDNMTVYVHGTFGATSPVGGSGTSSARYVWMNLGTENAGMKRLTFDFENCSQITLNCQSGYYYYGVGGNGIHLRNASIVANCDYSGSQFLMIGGTSGNICDDCTFVINAYDYGCIAYSGMFNNCNGTVINSSSNPAYPYCFDIRSGLLIINDGEYYSYSGNASGDSAIIYTGIAGYYATASLVCNTMRCPTAARSGLTQKQIFNATVIRGAANNLITSLDEGSSGALVINNTINYASPL